MKRGTSAIAKAYRGTTAVKKVMIGTNLVWADWIYYTGQFYTMSSASTPSPFVASDYTTGFNLAGAPYQVFDNNNGTQRYGEANNAGQRVGASLSFGQSIKIQQIYVNYEAYGGLNFSFNAFVDAYDSVNGVWRNLYNSGQQSSGFAYGGYISVDTTYQYSHIRLYVVYNSGGTLGGWGINSCQVTQWYKQG